MPPNRPTNRRRPLAFEQFETRRLMAIIVGYAPGIVPGSTGQGLSISSTDGEPNDFAIVGTGNAGEIIVTGRNGTVVNGVVDGAETFPGVTSDVQVRTFRNASNRVAVDNVYIAGHLWLVLSSTGNSTAILGREGVVSTTGEVLIDAYGSNNVVRLENYNVFAGGAISVDVQNFETTNDDIVLVGASTGIGNVRVNVNNGNDSIYFDGVTSSAAFYITAARQYQDNGEKYIALLRSSAATFAYVALATSTRYSSIYVDTCFFGESLRVFGNTNELSEQPGPTGMAEVTIARCLSPQIVVRTGQANDRVHLYGNYLTGTQFTGQRPIQTLYIDTRSGDDDVRLSYNIVLDNVYAALGNASDSLSAVGNRFDKIVYFNGGVGEYQTGPDGLNRLTLVNNTIAIPAFFHFS